VVYHRIKVKLRTAKLGLGTMPTSLLGNTQLGKPTELMMEIGKLSSCGIVPVDDPKNLLKHARI